MTSTPCRFSSPRLSCKFAAAQSSWYSQYSLHMFCLFVKRLLLPEASPWPYIWILRMVWDQHCSLAGKDVQNLVRVWMHCQALASKLTLLNAGPYDATKESARFLGAHVGHALKVCISVYVRQIHHFMKYRENHHHWHWPDHWTQSRMASFHEYNEELDAFWSVPGKHSSI